MKLNVILSLGCMGLFAVSCAHQAVHEDSTADMSPKTSMTAPVEKPVVAKSVETNKGDTSLNCSLGEDTRIITLQKGDKRCEVHYTKSGNLDNIAWGEHTPSICDNVFENVRSNIEKGGFKCSDSGQKTASSGN